MRVVTPRRVAIVGVSLLSLVLCCGLALWQWNRFESATGTWQNLGYVLQWPLFGAFPAFLFYRMRKLRDQQTSAEAEPEPAEVEPLPPRTPSTAPVRDDDDDPVLAEYNRYLRQLNARDRQETQ